MQVRGKHVVVTGGASGIGKALCEALSREGARAIVVADIDEARATDVAAAVGGAAQICDVSREDDIRRLIETAEMRSGPIDLFCSNAGIAAGFQSRFVNAAAVPDEVWQRAWSVNVMAHVYAARLLLPGMRARRSGYFLNTISAAGLLSQIGSAVYSTTKHAAVGFAENLAITHWDDGVRVSILCPQGVNTPMLHGIPAGPQSSDGVLSAEDVATAAVRGIETEDFLILPHAEVRNYIRNKAENIDRWIKGMVRLQKQIDGPYQLALRVTSATDFPT
ncbi:SDR family oxidoreductase [Bradyrhizobium diazoefficiens]|nr:SDR family oxidoreductase [Bradyrhizobium diazoefficiens]QQN65446.1 SDR family oxidoreductase [Bradyrhizobium diazoefficiens]